MSFPKPELPAAFIQWKGTFACMDVWCPCGQSSHIDHEFVYYVKCTGCGRVFETSPYIQLRELPAEEVLAMEPREPIEAAG